MYLPNTNYLPNWEVPSGVIDHGSLFCPCPHPPERNQQQSVGQHTELTVLVNFNKSKRRVYFENIEVSELVLDELSLLIIIIDYD